MSTENPYAKLAVYDVPTLSNAIERFGVRSRTAGFASPSVRALFPGSGTFLGHAATARMSALEPAPAESDDILDRYYRAVREAPRPTVAVIEDVDQPTVGSFWGEVQTSIHRALGCSGVITNGGVRDLDEMNALGFRVWSGCVLVSHAYVHLISAGETVCVGGLLVAPGDLLAADRHGVLAIPVEVVDDLAAACAEVVEAEKAVIEPCRQAIEDDRCVDVDELQAWRAEMKRRRSG